LTTKTGTSLATLFIEAIRSSVNSEPSTVGDVKPGECVSSGILRHRLEIFSVVLMSSGCPQQAVELQPQPVGDFLAPADERAVEEAISFDILKRDSLQI